MKKCGDQETVLGGEGILPKEKKGHVIVSEASYFKGGEPGNTIKLGGFCGQRIIRGKLGSFGGGELENKGVQHVFHLFYRS